MSKVALTAEELQTMARNAGRMACISLSGEELKAARVDFMRLIGEVWRLRAKVRRTRKKPEVPAEPIHYVPEPRDGDPTTSDPAKVTCPTCLRNAPWTQDAADRKVLIQIQKENVWIAPGAAKDSWPVTSDVSDARVFQNETKARAWAKEAELPDDMFDIVAAKPGRPPNDAPCNCGREGLGHRGFHYPGAPGCAHEPADPPDDRETA